MRLKSRRIVDDDDDDDDEVFPSLSRRRWRGGGSGGEGGGAIVGWEVLEDGSRSGSAIPHDVSTGVDKAGPTVVEEYNIISRNDLGGCFVAR